MLFFIEFFIMRINICLISDENFIQHLTVTMASILANANIDDDLYFYILLDKALSSETKEKILTLQKIKKFNIYFIEVEKSIFNNYSNVRKMANFKFFLGDILKDVDKILYLDCDLVVLTSLKDLFSENIDNYYLAGADNIGHYFLYKDRDYFISDFYINSGVMLINLKLWRQDNLKDKFITIKEKNIKNFIFVDQDVINLCCENKIKPLDLSWNMHTGFFKNFYFHPMKEEIKKAIANPKIIHYSSFKKPWNAYSPLMKFYYKYLALTPFNKNITFKFKLKVFFTYFIFLLDILNRRIRVLFSPVIKRARKNKVLRKIKDKINVILGIDKK